ncbi:MAG TPA: DUF1634 domain-containing protein [Edaphocola sp.]|nr:DUF1634 domain-containing protein [Edaphocola sp.]
MMRKQKQKQKRDLELVISNTLRIGVWSSFWISLFGIVLLIFQNGQQIIDAKKLPEIPQKFSFVALLEGIKTFDATQITMLGVLLLLITPLLRVIFALFAYQQQKNKQYVWITFIVLVIIMISIWIGIMH